MSAVALPVPLGKVPWGRSPGEGQAFSWRERLTAEAVNTATEAEPPCREKKEQPRFQKKEQWTVCRGEKHQVNNPPPIVWTK